MTKTLTDHILSIVENATAQQPMRYGDVATALVRVRPETTPDEPHDALEALVAQRLLSTARITRGGITHDVYWPTGLKTPVLTGIKPKEPIAVPIETLPATPTETEPDTNAQRLIKAIVAHGPINNADLAEMTGVAAKSIDSVLRSAMAKKQITNRRIYVPDAGRDLRHWMTATQAEEWDVQQGHAMSHPSAIMAPAARAAVEQLQDDLRDLAAERDGLIGLIGATGLSEAIAMIEARRAEMHDLKNEVAARTLIMSQLAEIVGVENHEDILGAVERMTADRPAPTPGRLALLLIDSADLTEIEELPTNDDGEAHTRALATVEHGHAARAVVVRIQGEAVRTVAWKAAA
ncbi:MAG: hypothetical protein EKK55_23245 [Rhodocyclaceae bacterium]|nr:MAG: hypothetical protein EKK55_23245 [Rhodocyclaceae bacterium]